MTNVNDLLVLKISISFNAIDEDGQPVREYLEYTLGVGLEDAEDTCSFLQQISDAVGDERLYGWMMQEKMNASIEVGDVRPESLNEIAARVSSECSHGQAKGSER